ncbi:cell shape determination protein CcmA [Lysobacter helvus]|uniref:Cell shape determination protein CcmA n=2 Tax=Lysobacteraceae TaxID=32033 RepID=A0ABM7Q1G9_9GAMM|nr:MULTISPECIES: polymer-forming cytoskeletal protein [Lysobacter]BCT91059.1 cell shape determination protein CcmA [Lysobacter caseinilyticus]BCT94212.1 cell shape determination protein CcmA [Lysobacter helvus]
MALWKDQPAPAANKPAPSPAASTEAARFQPETTMPPSTAPASSAPTAVPTAAPPRPAARQVNESLIAADLTIEGKIHGTGHVRIAGQFKGDVNVEGDLTIEKGAKLTGGVRAQKITIAGELEGNIESAQRVDLLESGVLTGDVKAASFTVAAGSRMRGQVEFGWDEKAGSSTTRSSSTDNA